MSEWSYDEANTPRKRGYIIVQALIFAPLTLLLLAGVGTAVYHITIGDTGYLVMLVIAGIFSLVLGLQTWLHLLDINSEPVVTEGPVTKKWTKGNLFFFFMPSYYVAVKGKILAIARVDYAHLLEGDVVRVRHYPHTLTVEAVERFDTYQKKFLPAAEEGG